MSRAPTTQSGAVSPAAPTATAYDRVLHTIGAAIVSGELAAGHADSVEGLGQRTGASRSIVREATRVLVGLGMLTAGRRVGLRVRPREAWNVLDPLVIGWRLAGPDRTVQLDELRELRRAVEPAAARSAASADRRSPDGLEARPALAGAATALRNAASAGDAATFLQADRRLHVLVLTLSGNAMFVRLGDVVETVLRDRATGPVDAHDVDLHVRLVAAIEVGDPPRAATLMTEIVDRTH